MNTVGEQLVKAVFILKEIAVRNRENFIYDVDLLQQMANDFLHEVGDFLDKLEADPNA